MIGRCLGEPARPLIRNGQVVQNYSALHRRRNWTFAGSDAGGRRAAAIYTLMETAKLNDVDPRAWLADVLKRLPEHPAKRVHELLPWTWKTGQFQQAAA